jgi:hypothetical protein
MSRHPIPCANKTDIGVFVCYIPISMLLYACSFLMLRHITPPLAHENTMFVMYGCVQCGLGFLAGYCTSRWIYYQNTRHQRAHPTLQSQPTEEAQLLITPLPPSADSEEIDLT